MIWDLFSVFYSALKCNSEFYSEFLFYYSPSLSLHTRPRIHTYKHISAILFQISLIETEYFRKTYENITKSLKLQFFRKWGLMLPISTTLFDALFARSLKQLLVEEFSQLLLFNISTAGWKERQFSWLCLNFSFYILSNVLIKNIRKNTKKMNL